MRISPRSGARARALLSTMASLATVASIAIVAAAPGHAETIGGEQLSSSHRTVSLGPGAKELPEVWAESWILADATTGEVLAAKNPHLQRAPASTLKTLTALTVMPQTTPDQAWKATQKAASAEGSRVGLKPGKEYTLDELWLAVFLPSANDAAIGVAQANGGVKKTVRQMNQTAARLQARDTVAKTPNGLDRKGQVTSAYDLALIGRAAMQVPGLADYAGRSKAMFPDVKGKGKHPIYTTNRLLLNDYKGITGLKTGFTTQAGRTFIGTATRKGTSLIVALLGIHESTDDAARKLLTWGFKNRDNVTPIGTLVDPLPEGTAPDEATQAATSAGESGTDAGSSEVSATAAGSVGAVAPQPTSTSSAAVYAGAVVLLLALAGGGFALTRARMGRYRGRHLSR